MSLRERERERERERWKILTKMRKLKTNMRYLMQLRQSPSMVVPRAEASPCPWEKKTTHNTTQKTCHLMSPAKRSQKFPFFCTFDRHSDETAKKIILCKNLRTFLMSSATQTYNTHTHSGLSVHLVQFQLKILVLSPQAHCPRHSFLSNP